MTLFIYIKNYRGGLSHVDVFGVGRPTPNITRVLSLSRLELLTIRLSGVYSNQLSYRLALYAWKDSNSQLPNP